MVTRHGLEGWAEDEDWAFVIRGLQQVIPGPFASANPVDLTRTLQTLTDAGLAPTIESWNTLRLGDGRRARVASPHAHRSRIPDDDDPELLLLNPVLDDRFGVRPIRDAARSAPNLLLVDGFQQQVWVDGRQVFGDRPDPQVQVDRYAVLAVARIISVLGGRTHDIAARTGLTIGQVGDALSVLGEAVEHTEIGWEAKDFFALIDVGIAAYPGVGGITTSWTHPEPLRAQADLLRDAGVRLADEWTIDGTHNVEPSYGLLAYAEQMPDMAGLGFTTTGYTPDTRGAARIVIPEDHTIFHTARVLASRTGGVDDAIAAAAVLNRPQTDSTRKVLSDLRHRIWFRADVTYDLRWDLPD